MLSGSAIQSISDVAAYRAAQDAREPLLIWNAEQDAHGLPFLGPYVPQGWRPEGDTLLVDSSGFGAPGELALTFGQFIEHIETHPALAWAIVEAGQFQVVVQGYIEDADAEGVEAPEPDPCQYCDDIHDDVSECEGLATGAACTSECGIGCEPGECDCQCW